MIALMVAACVRVLVRVLLQMVAQLEREHVTMETKQEAVDDMLESLFDNDECARARACMGARRPKALQTRHTHVPACLAPPLAATDPFAATDRCPGHHRDSLYPLTGYFPRGRGQLLL